MTSLNLEMVIFTSLIALILKEYFVSMFSFPPCMGFFCMLITLAIVYAVTGKDSGRAIDVEAEVKDAE